jgi:tetratricopeptide (TPR) repeat protein
MRHVIEDLVDLKALLRKEPDDAHALRAAGNFFLKDEKYKIAKDYYSQAVGLYPRLLPEIIIDYERKIFKNPNIIGTRLSLSVFKLAQGETDASILELEESLDIDPKNVSIYNVLGKIYAKQERIDDVISLLEKSVEEGIKDVALTEILASAYLEKGRLQDAIRFYKELLSFKPGDKTTLRILGELYTRIEEYDCAADNYQAMFSDDPEVAREVIQRLEGLLKKVEGNVSIREILADIYMKSIKPELAVEKLCEILRLDPAKLLDVISKLKGILKSYPDHPEATLALADALRVRGNFSESVEAYYGLVKRQPEYLGQAIAGYQRILEHCPEQLLARTFLAEAFLYQKNIKDALLEFEKIVRIDPNSADSIIVKCREIIKSEPNLHLARLVLGRAYMVKGDLQRAALEAEGIVSIDKNYTKAYLLLGEVYFKLKLCRKAVGVLKSALIMEPYNLFVQEQYKNAMERELDIKIQSTKERTEEDQWKISLHLDLAKLYINKGRKEDAIRELQISVKDKARAALAYDLLGCVHRTEGRLDLAAAQFKKAKEAVSPELDDFKRMIQFNLGTTFEGQGDIHRALEIYEGILQEDIDFGNLRKKIEYLKSSSLHSLRDKALVAVITQQAKGEIVAFWGREGKMSHFGQREPMSVSFGQNYNNSGFEYYMKGMYKGAIEEFSLAVQLDANFAIALNNLGIALAKEGRLGEAKIRIEHAVHVYPNSVILHNNLGIVSRLLGDIEKAKQEFEKAAAIDPDLPAVCINLGDIYYVKKEIEPAIREYQKIGSYDVLSDIAKQRLLYKVPD